MTYTHIAIRKSLRERIQSGEWALGARIPDEIDLAVEYGCARTTVNRALQALADQGLIVRKRKGGTRIIPLPIRQAKFEIPILREEIEKRGGAYAHTLVERRLNSPPSSIRARLRLGAKDDALYIETLHSADGRPYAFEIRWVNTNAVPEILDAPLDQVSANEWLVRTVPYSTGDVAFTAVNADSNVAAALKIAVGAAVFVVDRSTWLGDDFITTTKLYFHEDYQLYANL